MTQGKPVVQMQADASHKVVLDYDYFGTGASREESTGLSLDPPPDVTPDQEGEDASLPTASAAMMSQTRHDVLRDALQALMIELQNSDTALEAAEFGNLVNALLMEVPPGLRDQCELAILQVVHLFKERNNVHIVTQDDLE
ncbi:uncharacterized protein LOC135372343 [Ornithodoros turicata]|uniref:uncharacterized protein LOC135372343 n=1 Tax=Ornithodoros turicata TaxID=34597 RepID=UPI003139F5AB